MYSISHNKTCQGVPVNMVKYQKVCKSHDKEEDGNAYQWAEPHLILEWIYESPDINLWIYVLESH